MTCANLLIRKLKDSNKKIAVWGTGKDAVKATHLLKLQGIDVELYVSGLESRETNSFLGKPIVSSLEVFRRSDLFYVVAVSAVHWPNVKEKLASSGYEEISKFINYRMIDTDKKMVMLHGNCHLDIVTIFLESSGSFNEKYWIYPYERVCNLVGNRSFDPVIPYADVWIYQPIRKDNSLCFEVSDEHTLSLVREDALRISVPNYYGYGKILFPQTVWGNPHNPPLSDGRDKNGFFPRSDSVIDKWVENNAVEIADVCGDSDHDIFHDCLDELICLCRSDNAMEEKDILDNYNQNLEKIFERDAECDVKVAGFIKENFKDYQMFYDLGHPTNVVLKEISVGILERLGIRDYNDISCSDKLCVHEDPVYPQVKSVLDLKWEQKWLRDTENSKKIAERMDFAEYIREYIWWCYLQHKPPTV